MKPHEVFHYFRPDEVAETWDGVSEELYKILWNSLSGEKPLSEQIDMEESSPSDAIGICCVASLWSKFTPEEQEQLNELAVKHDEECQRLSGF